LLALPTPKNRWFVNQLKLCDLIAFSGARMLASLDACLSLHRTRVKRTSGGKPNETHAQLRLLVDNSPHERFHQLAQRTLKR
jgi:hypothetical protein